MSALFAVATAAAWRFFYREPTPEWEDRANAAIEKALALNPNLAEAYVARANLLWTQPRGFPHAQALREFRRAIALNPNSAEAPVAIARVYEHVGLLEEARQELTMAMELNPFNAEARPRLIASYYWLGRRGEALTWLRKAAAEGFPCYPLFANDPNLAGMAGDADFEAFMTGMKTQGERLRAEARR